MSADKRFRFKNIYNNKIVWFWHTIFVANYISPLLWVMSQINLFLWINLWKFPKILPENHWRCQYRCHIEHLTRSAPDKVKWKHVEKARCLLLHTCPMLFVWCTYGFMCILYLPQCTSSHALFSYHDHNDRVMGEGGGAYHFRLRWILEIMSTLTQRLIAVQAQVGALHRGFRGFPPVNVDDMRQQGDMPSYI